MTALRKQLATKINHSESLIGLLHSKSNVLSLLLELWKICRAHPDAINYLTNNATKAKNKIDYKYKFPKEFDSFRRKTNPKKNLSQLFATKATLCKKLDMLAEKLSTTKSIILVGDDDLLSIVLGFNFKNLDILVLDIDKGVLGCIDKVSKKYNLRIKTRYYDVRKPLPQNLAGRFDYFIFDSSHCLGGYVSFLTRALLSLKKEKHVRGQFVLQLIDDPPVFTKRERKKLFDYIKRRGFIVKRIAPESVEYDLPENLLTKFTFELCNLFKSGEPSKEKLRDFLLKFNFAEFMPYNSLLPEAIIELWYEKTQSISNDFYHKDWENTYGSMYFYKEYERKQRA